MLESNVEKEKVKRRFTSVVTLSKRMYFKRILVGLVHFLKPQNPNAIRVLCIFFLRTQMPPVMSKAAAMDRHVISDSPPPYCGDKPENCYRFSSWPKFNNNIYKVRFTPTCIV